MRLYKQSYSSELPKQTNIKYKDNFRSIHYKVLHNSVTIAIL